MLLFCAVFNTRFYSLRLMPVLFCFVLFCLSFASHSKCMRLCMHLRCEHRNYAKLVWCLLLMCMDDVCVCVCMQRLCILEQLSNKLHPNGVVFFSLCTHSHHIYTLFCSVSLGNGRFDVQIYFIFFWVFDISLPVFKGQIQILKHSQMNSWN